MSQRVALAAAHLGSFWIPERPQKSPTTYAAKKRRAIAIAGINLRKSDGFRLRRYIVELAGGAERFNALDLPARTLVIQAATAVMQTEAMAAETVKGAVIALSYARLASCGVCYAMCRAGSSRPMPT
jgi:hypothetical protein